ncbi:MAG: hypothetical protein JWM11_1461 [Planctomycetaceae bacterium]|nr:hypothetical protein [Planctomycetaceae bacterium]
MNFNHLTIATTTILVMAGSIQSASAQDFPGLGVGNMWANEIRFQNQFDRWNRQGSMELARRIPNDQPLPFNAMTISNSNNANMRAFEGYMRNSQLNSNRQLEAVGRFSTYGIRGMAPHYDTSGYGGPVMLPYGPNGYYATQGGFSPSQTTFAPSQNAWGYGAYRPYGN